MKWQIGTDIIAFLTVMIIMISMEMKGNFDRHTNRDLRFSLCIWIFLFDVLVDIVSSVVYSIPVSDKFFRFTQTLYHATGNLVIVSWFHYAVAVICKDNKKIIKYTDIASAVVYGAFLLFVLIDIKFNYIFSYFGGVYARGFLFYIPLGIFLLYAAATLILTFIGKSTPPILRFVLAIVPVFSAVGIALQLTLDGWLTIASFYALGVLAAYLAIQEARAKKVIKTMESEASRDTLTKLGNRHYAEVKISEQLTKNDSGVLLMVDLDNLKTINDGFGHEAGDCVLRSIGSLLSEFFPNEKNIIARYGGDEFLVYIPSIEDKTQLKNHVARFVFNLSLVKIPSYPDIKPSCSIGVAFSDEDETTLDNLLRQADSALYQVKRNGKNDFAVYSKDTELINFQHTRVDELARNHEEWYNEEDLRHTFRALSRFLPYVLSINLTKNSYYAVENDPLITDRLPVYGTYDDLIKAACEVFHPSDKDYILTYFSGEGLRRAFSEGTTSVSKVLRHKSRDGEYRWAQTVCMFEQKEDEEDLHACMFIRPYENEHSAEIERMGLLKIFELAVHTAFEYVSILNTEDGSIKVYGNDGKNTHAVPKEGVYDKIVRQIADEFITEAERAKFVSDAGMPMIVNALQKRGHYKYRYRIGNEFRIVGESRLCTNRGLKRKQPFPTAFPLPKSIPALCYVCLTFRKNYML